MAAIRILSLILLLIIPVAAVAQNQPAPEISSLGSGCDNWDCIWILGSHFHSNSYVYVYSADWSTYQVFWGPAWAQSPGMNVDSYGTLITLQITDPGLRNSFGNAGVYVLVVNADSSTSDWRWTHSPPPVIYSGDAGCDAGSWIGRP